jgi:hypothetical protein
MAELNVFKTVTKTIDTSNQTIYTAPSSYTGIVLSTQIANASDSDATLTFTKMVSNKDNKLKLVMGILESLNG